MAWITDLDSKLRVRILIKKPHQIGYSRTINRGSVLKFSSDGDSGQGRITSITLSDDGDAFPIGDFFPNCPQYAVGHIILHGLPPLLKTGFPEIGAVPSGTSKIDLKHCIPATGKELNFAVFSGESPHIPPPWASVRNND